MVLLTSLWLSFFISIPCPFIFAFLLRYFCLHLCLCLFFPDPGSRHFHLHVCPVQFDFLMWIFFISAIIYSHLIHVCCVKEFCSFLYFEYFHQKFLHLFSL